MSKWIIVGIAITLVCAFILGTHEVSMKAAIDGVLGRNSFFGFIERTLNAMHVINPITGQKYTFLDWWYDLLFPGRE